MCQYAGWLPSLYKLAIYLFYTRAFCCLSNKYHPVGIALACIWCSSVPRTIGSRSSHAYQIVWGLSFIARRTRLVFIIWCPEGWFAFYGLRICHATLGLGTMRVHRIWSNFSKCWRKGLDKIRKMRLMLSQSSSWLSKILSICSSAKSETHYARIPDKAAAHISTKSTTFFTTPSSS